MLRAAYIFIITTILKGKKTCWHAAPSISTFVFLTRQQIPFQLKPMLSVKGFIFVTIDNTGYISHSHSNLVCKSSSSFSKMLVGSQTHDLKWQLLVSVRLLEVWAVLYKQIDKWRPQARLEMFVYKCPLLQLPGEYSPPPPLRVFPELLHCFFNAHYFAPRCIPVTVLSLWIDLIELVVAEDRVLLNSSGSALFFFPALSDPIYDQVLIYLPVPYFLY